MADVITRFKVDSGDYESKLKRAMSAINDLGAEAEKAGNSIDTLNSDNVALAQALGEMETVSKGAKGQLRELTQAATDLSLMYARLTDEEKNSPFGQAMAASIKKLTERAGQAKDAMADVSAAISHAASDTRVFDQLSGGMRLMSSTFQTGVGAAKMFGIEMGDNVEVLAKLQAAMAVTTGLQQIQNAVQQQGVVMQGIAAVQSKALAAARSLETSGTVAATAAQAAFNAVAKANPYVLLASAIIAVGSALVIFSREAKKSAEEERQLALEAERTRVKMESQKAAAQALGQKTGNLLSTFYSLQNEWKRLKTVAEQKQWIDANKNSFAALGLKVNNVNDAYRLFVKRAPEVVAALKAIAEAEAMKDLYKDAIVKREKRERSVRTGDYYRVASSESDLTDDEKRKYVKQGAYIDYWGNAGDYDYDAINKARQEAALKTQKETIKIYDDNVNYYEKRMNQTAFIAAEKQKGLDMSGSVSGSAYSGAGGYRGGHGGGSGGSGGDGGNTNTEVKKQWTDIENIVNAQQIADNLAIIAEKSKTATASQIADLHQLKIEWEDYQKQWNNIGLEADDILPDLDVQKWAQEQFSKLTAIDPPKINLKPIEEQGTKTKESWQDAAKAVGAVGNALNQLEDPSAKIAGIIGQAIANIALGFASALSTEGGKTGVWGWIAAAAAGTATMISTITAIQSVKKQAGSYEEGGIIPGNSYHGDKLLANVNSGELILNTAQQSNVAAALQSSYQNNQSALGLGVRVRGEDLFTALDNYQRRTGKRFSA